MQIQRKPEWLRISRVSHDRYSHVSNLLSQQSLHTICRSGKCPNQAECWSRGTATFMLLGDICTRGCKFCATATGRPLPPDEGEPERLAASVEAMHLRYVVLTSVTRDDLPDQGANHWRRCIEAVRQRCPRVKIEALVPDFSGEETLVKEVLAAAPDVFAHNMETVARLTPLVRAKATYQTSLHTLSVAHEAGLRTKTGIMLGLGETQEEVLKAMDDALGAGVDIFTLGQYLQPSRRHYPVAEYITPEWFAEYKQIALDKGFSFVESGPLVRSSYHAEMALDDTSSKETNVHR